MPSIWRLVSASTTSRSTSPRVPGHGADDRAVRHADALRLCTLIATDTGNEWTVGSGAGARRRHRAGELAAWLTGRVARPEAELPAWI